MADCLLRPAAGGLRYLPPREAIYANVIQTFPYQRRNLFFSPESLMLDSFNQLMGMWPRHGPIRVIKFLSLPRAGCVELIEMHGIG